MDASIKLPDKLIEEAVRAELVRTIAGGPDAQKWIDAIVRQALTQKSDRWDSETPFGKAVGDMVRETAKQVFKEWLEANRDRIREALLNAIHTRENQLLNKIVDGLAKGLLTVAPTLKLEIVEVAEDEE